ncbi:MAG: hypothetical protein WCV84_02130 [Patescibacteria group bacterium]
MLHLVFNVDRQFLGEVHTERGVFKRVMLNEEGESLFGSQCGAWQATGISVRREVRHVQADGTREVAWYTERVLPRDASFEHALHAWAEEHEYFMTDLEEPYVPCWEQLLGLPFEPQERFAFLIALRLTPQTLLSEWRKSLDEARLLVQYEMAESHKAVEILKKKMSSQLTAPFAKQAIHG